MLLCVSRGIPELSNNEDGWLDNSNLKRWLISGNVYRATVVVLWNIRGSTKTVSSLIFIALFCIVKVIFVLNDMVVASFPNNTEIMLDPISWHRSTFTSFFSCHISVSIFQVDQHFYQTGFALLYNFQALENHDVLFPVCSLKPLYVAHLCCSSYPAANRPWTPEWVFSKSHISDKYMYADLTKRLSSGG